MMTRLRHVSARVSAGVLTIMAMGACSIETKATVDGNLSDRSGSLKVAFGDSQSRMPALGPGDVRIVSTDGVLVLSLIGDTVRMQLSDSLRNSVANDIRSGGDSSGDPTGIAAMVTKSVSKVVAGAMGFTVRAAASDVENLRYEDGHIRFDIRNSKATVKSAGSKENDARFAEEDARRFIDAVKKRAARSVAM